jgi:hypothetical protein
VAPRGVDRHHVPVTRKQLAIGAAVVVVLLAAGLTWLLWPRSAPPPPPRARVYADYTACLLTGAQGLTAEPAKTVWSGMQSSSSTTKARVQYLTVTDPQTADNAATFLASLAHGKCGVVFTTGDASNAAAVRDAPKYPDVTFYVVGGPASPGTDPANLRRIPADSTNVDNVMTKNVTKALRTAAPTTK